MKLVFIVGAPRSGTTLMQRLLADQPGVATVPETGIFGALSPSFGRVRGLPPLCSRPIPVVSQATTLTRVGTYVRKRAGIDVAELSGNYRSDTAEWILSTFQLNAPAGTEWFVEKTPSHAYYYRQILRLFPDSRIVWMVRDPRDMVASFLSARPEWSGRSVAETAWRWKRTLPPSESPANIVSVRYEDLVENTSNVVDSISPRLGLDITVQPEASANVTTDRLIRPEETHKLRAMGAIHSRRGTYLEKLSEEDIRTVEQICRRGMRAWGYPTSTQLGLPLVPAIVELKIQWQRGKSALPVAARQLLRW